MTGLTLLRDHRDGRCTLGRLTLPDGAVLHTIERTWVPNQHGGRSGEKHVSCIAPGTYTLRSHTRPSGDRVWALVNPELDVYYLPSDVPEGREDATRTLILIHAGNFWYDIIGCIAPGLSRNMAGPNGTWMVTSSRLAMRAVRDSLRGVNAPWIRIDENL